MKLNIEIRARDHQNHVLSTLPMLCTRCFPSVFWSGFNLVSEKISKGLVSRHLPKCASFQHKLEVTIETH